MERSGMRVGVPDFAALHPGYGIRATATGLWIVRFSDQALDSYNKHSIREELS
jgi:hypothetical protein